MSELNRNVTLLACQIDVPATTTAAERDAHTDRVAAAIDAELNAGGPVDFAAPSRPAAGACAGAGLWHRLRTGGGAERVDSHRRAQD